MRLAICKDVTDINKRTQEAKDEKYNEAARGFKWVYLVLGDGFGERDRGFADTVCPLKHFYRYMKIPRSKLINC